MSLRLKVEHGQDAGRVWRLKDAGAYIVGRDATSAIRVLDMKVSKGHCEIHVLNGNDGGARIRDLKSTHGTQLNGQPLARETELKPGDEIRLGFTVLRLLSDGPADAGAAPNGPLPKPEAAAPAAAPPASAPAAGGPPTNVTAPWAKDSLASSGAAAAAAASAKEPPKSLPPDELVGKTLAGYRVIRKIGQGGMGAVYMAEQVSLKREVALKVLSEKFVADSAFVDQFLNEARAAGQLNHPNVVQVYDVGQAEGRYFFSMEFVPGGAIEDKVKGGRTAEWPDALNWFLDATNALIFAQKRGILHRDVKPDNLMLAEDGSAKLCDLGLAKKSESQDLLAQGIIGTPHFLSPEAIRRRPDIDHRTDLYSLGCTFYRILSGENPYPAKTVKDILLGHLNKPVPRITDKKPDVPKDLSDVVYQLMQKEPAQRYASADELYTALDKIRIQHGLAAHGIKPGSKKPLVIAAIVALLAAGAVAWVLTRPKEVAPEDPAVVAQRRREKEESDRRLAAANQKELELCVEKARVDVGSAIAEATTHNVEKNWNAAVLWEGYFAGLDKLRERLKNEVACKDHPEMAAIVESLDAHKAKIAEQLKFQRENAKQIEDERLKVGKDIETALSAHLEKYKSALVPVEGSIPKWWEAAALVDRGAVEAILKPLRERAARFKVGGQEIELLKDKDIDEKAKKVFPGTDWAGQDLFKDALAAGERAHRATMQSIAETAREPRTAETLEAAARAFLTYRDQIPEPGFFGPEIIAKLQSQRDEAAAAAEANRTAADDVREKTRAIDRVNLHRLIRYLREPERGKMDRFDFGRPMDEAQRLAGMMGDEAYKRFANMLLADDKALTQLFDNLRTAFDAKAWKNFELEDEAGKQQKVTEVSTDGLTCPVKTKRLWVEYGARFLLERVFYVKPGRARFEFSPLDHRGLAVLAELAAQAELAATHWQQYGASVTGDVEASLTVSRRLAWVQREVQAADKIRFVAEGLRLLEKFQDDNALPSEPGPITEAQRDKINRERFTKLEQVIQDVEQTLLVLHMDEELATTIWGTAVRSQVHPRAAYGGETVPASVKGPERLVIPEPPPKEDKNKPADKPPK